MSYSLAPQTAEQISPRILFIDAFDSFSNSIVGLLERELGARVTVVRINDENVSTHFEQYTMAFDAVVVGPGPGHPANPDDVGLINKLWSLSQSDMLPVFGICLGFQSLALAHGAVVNRLKQPRHGITTSVTHTATDIFASTTSNFMATQYHSLAAQLSSTFNSTTNSLTWEPTTDCPELQPLAWDLTDATNGPILMAVRHVEKPFWGVQFHPESICTSKDGREVVHSWWALAKKWIAAQPRHNSCTADQRLPWDTQLDDSEASDRETTLSALSGLSSLTGSSNSPSNGSEITLASLPEHSRTDSQPVKTEKFQSSALSHIARRLQAVIGTDTPLLRWAKHSAQGINPVTLCEYLELERDEIVMLDSQNHPSGRYSIIGITVPGKSPKITYFSNNHTLQCRSGLDIEYSNKVSSIDEVWFILQEVLQLFNPRKQQPPTRSSGMDRMVSGNLPSESPFWGGFMGYITYEAGLETIDVELHESCVSNTTPDVNFAFVYRSIVVDHHTNQVYVQSLSPNDWDWILRVGLAVDRLTVDTHKDVVGRTLQSSVDERIALERMLSTAIVTKPQEAEYRRQVLQCQESLSSGDSYELCLTGQTLINIPRLHGECLDPWSLYKKLRAKNPAPFGAFVRLSGTLIVGTSPERFLNWTREGRCQFRPIKGTVKKTPTLTRAEAHAILNSSKERAENLMIVDLIRHDLGGVIGTASVEVPKLMVVEEYETVYQLVSVIEGQIPQPTDSESNDQVITGLDVLTASLPPGSMTGAPKKRSCEILRDIEKRPRGIYSGVLGYLDVGGAGDFSVVIRTTFRPSQTGGLGHDINDDTWIVGAGGAVTIQSTDEAEYLEMETKLSSALQVFQSA